VRSQLARLSANNDNSRGRSIPEDVSSRPLTALNSNKRDRDNTSSGFRLTNNNNSPSRTQIPLRFAANIRTAASDTNHIDRRSILRKRFSGNATSDTIVVGGTAVTRPSCL